VAVFTAEFRLKVDGKGRVSVPAPYRATLAQAGLSSIALGPVYDAAALEGYPGDRLEQIAEKLDDETLYSEEEREELLLLFSELRELSIDGDGRILLPEELRQHAEIADKAVYAGRGKTFRIWNPEQFDAYRSKMRPRLEKSGRSLILRTGGGGKGQA